jgi:predicted alpha/beta hydrolase family esterase
MTSSAFVLLHGWQNHREPDHWHHWLRDELVARGFAVRYPQLPDPDRPSLDAWIDTYIAELDACGPAEVTVVCHSLSVPTWLHAVASGRVPEVENVILVSPPSASVLAGIGLSQFTWHPSGGDGVGARGAVAMIVGDHDPYCPEGPDDQYVTPLRIPKIVIPGGGHLSTPDGYGPWPQLLAWCLDPSTLRSLTARQ